MAVTEEIAWGDGTSDKIYLTATAFEGDQTVLVSSDANNRAPRTKTITFSATGAEPVILTVSQEGGTGTQYTLTFIPSFYDTTDYSYYSVSNIDRAYTNSSSSNYAQISLTTGSRAETWLYFGFDVSLVPANAWINSVSCDVKGAVSTGNANVIAARTVQLFSGTTEKGDSTNIGTATSISSLSSDSWTRAELDDVRFKVFIKRGTSQNSSSQFVRIFGATLTVTYTVYE